MGKFVPAIQSMRLRTLPLSLAGVLLGTLLAVADYKVKGLTVLFLVLTTICLQILSNLSNELGDVLHGTDTADRQGPQYGLNGGGMSVTDMKRLIGLFVVLCVIFGLAMIKVSAPTPQVREEVASLAELFHAKVVDVQKQSLVLRLTGREDHIDALLEVLEDYEIIEIARTGQISLSRGLVPVKKM